MKAIKLCDIYTCTQCHACEAVCPKHCISFEVGKDGFSIPKIDALLCVQCGLCTKSCHQLNPIREKSTPIRANAAWSLDMTVRGKSSSGGVFSELAKRVFSRHGVVVGAVMNNQLRVVHTIAMNEEQLVSMRGSKYVQSDLTGIYPDVKKLLKEGRFVLFTGTPCQVSGLYSYLKKDYENLLTCDLVCHGVPSQKAFDTYCDKIGLCNSNIAEVRFRYTEGWGFQMAYRENTEHLSNDSGYRWKNISPWKSYFLRAFTSGLMFNEACYKCQYATPERVSDLTMADYWGIGTKMPFNHPKAKGVSLLLINTEKGRALVLECESLYVEERPMSEAIAGNHNLSCCSERPSGRDTYCMDSEKKNNITLMKKYGIMPSLKDFLRPIKRKLKK